MRGNRFKTQVTNRLPQLRITLISLTTVDLQHGVSTTGHRE